MATVVKGPAPPRAWHYVAEGRRDLRLDLLRGFAVLAMVVDHLGGASWLHAFTGGNRFFVSAAEGFVFISGVVVGIIYGGLAHKSGLRAATLKLLQRAWLLYALAVWLALGLALCAALLGSPLGAPFAAAPARFILEVVTLQRTVYLVDVLLLYLFAMLAAPLALAALRRGWWWAVALGSWGLWGAYQLDPRSWQVPWPIADHPVFHFAPWQLLFFIGLLLGYHRDQLAARLAARWPRSPLRDGYVLPLGALVGVLVWLHATDGAAFDRFAPGGDAAAVLDAWFLKSQLPPARLLACAIVFAFGWALVTRLWRPLQALCGPLLLVLGQGALYAYAVHIFLSELTWYGAAATWGAGPHGGFPPLSSGVNAAIQIGGVLLVWLLTRHQVLREVVAPLGRPPLVPGRVVRGRYQLRRPSDALLAIALVCAVAAGSALPRQLGAGGAPASTGAGGEGGSPPQARPAPTVTAPRSIAGAVGTAPEGQGGTAAATTSSAGGGERGADAPAGAALQSGYLVDGQFYSPTLGRTMPYGIYLPPGYDEDAARYPVLYMLHGAGGHYSEWASYGLAEAAERLIQAGRIAPLIIVLPQGDVSYFANHAGAAGERWGDYLVRDLVGHVDTAYRTIPQHTARAIGGLSMGGFGALHLGFTHPDVFGVVGAHSPSLRTYEEAPAYLGDREAYALVDPLALARLLDPAGAPRVWIDVGIEDEWAARTTALKEELRARGIRPEYHETAGDHAAEYWSRNAGRYLRYYGSVLAPEAAAHSVPPR